MKENHYFTATQLNRPQGGRIQAAISTDILSVLAARCSRRDPRWMVGRVQLRLRGGSMLGGRDMMGFLGVLIFLLSGAAFSSKNKEILIFF